MTDENDDSFLDEGVPTYLGFGHTVTFYPLPWGVQRRTLSTEWKILFGGGEGVKPASDAWNDAAVKVLFASATRGEGNPGLTEDALADMIDHRNLARCFKALGAASGLKPRTGDAVRPTEAPNGASSTTLLSPPPAGLSTSVTN